MTVDDLWWPVMTFDDLWYGDDANGIALWQFWTVSCYYYTKCFHKGVWHWLLCLVKYYSCHFFFYSSGNKLNFWHLRDFSPGIKDIFEYSEKTNFMWVNQDQFGLLKNTIEQCSDVWFLLRSEPTFLWKNQFELIFDNILLKTNMFNSFRAKSSRKFFSRQNLDFCGIYFQWPLWNWVF